MIFCGDVRQRSERVRQADQRRRLVMQTGIVDAEQDITRQNEISEWPHFGACRDAELIAVDLPRSRREDQSPVRHAWGTDGGVEISGVVEYVSHSQSLNSKEGLAYEVAR